MALADGGLAGVQQVLEASVPFDAVLMDMQMPDIDGLEATRRIRADGRFAGLPILGHDRQRLAGRPRSRPAAGMNDHVAKPIDKERLVLCLLGHLGRSGAGRAGNGSGRGRTGRGAGDIVGRFGGELIVRVLRRFVPDMQDLFAQLERQLGEGDVQAAPRPCIPSRAALPPLAPAPPPAVPASWSRPCAAPICAAWKSAGIRLDELRTLCDACLLRLQAMFGDVQAESAS